MFSQRHTPQSSGVESAGNGSKKMRLTSKTPLKDVAMDCIKQCIVVIASGGGDGGCSNQQDAVDDSPGVEFFAALFEELDKVTRQHPDSVTA